MNWKPALHGVPLQDAGLPDKQRRDPSYGGQAAKGAGKPGATTCVYLSRSRLARRFWRASQVNASKLRVKLSSDPLKDIVVDGSGRLPDPVRRRVMRQFPTSRPLGSYLCESGGQTSHNGVSG